MTEQKPLEELTRDELVELAGDLPVDRSDGREDLEPTADDYRRAIRRRDAVRPRATAGEPYTPPKPESVFWMREGKRIEG